MLSLFCAFAVMVWRITIYLVILHIGMYGSALKNEMFLFLDDKIIFFFTFLGTRLRDNR